jgi:hypothetical protein
MDDLNSLTVPDLKKLLSDKGLSQKGRKSELISRLQEVINFDIVSFLA